MKQAAGFIHSFCANLSFAIPSLFSFFAAVLITSFNFLCADIIYTSPPEGFSPKIEVAGCFCEHEGKVLFMLRHPKKPQGGTWCVPGGKIEKGETPREAIIREVFEEIGINLREAELHYCRKVFVRFPDTEFVLHLFKARLDFVPTVLPIALAEHDAYRWVTLPQALKMKLIPGEMECIYLVYPQMGIRASLEELEWTP